MLPRIASIGTALRWTAAMTVIEAFEPLAESSGAVLAARGAAIERRLESNPALVPVPGLQPRGRAGRMKRAVASITFGNPPAQQ